MRQAWLLLVLVSWLGLGEAQAKDGGERLILFERTATGELEAYVVVPEAVAKATKPPADFDMLSYEELETTEASAAPTSSVALPSPQSLGYRRFTVKLVKASELDWGGPPLPGRTDGSSTVP